MTKLERLGNKCTNTICRKECPVWYFTNKGVGNGTGNNCVEALRSLTWQRRLNCGCPVRNGAKMS